jgi:hypothetical protein
MILYLPMSEKITFSVVQYDSEMSPLNETELSQCIPFLNATITFAGFKVTITRRSSVYLTAVYMPSAMFVFISWIRYIKIITFFVVLKHSSADWRLAG